MLMLATSDKTHSCHNTMSCRPQVSEGILLCSSLHEHLASPSGDQAVSGYFIPYCLHVRKVAHGEITIPFSFSKCYVLINQYNS